MLDLAALLTSAFVLWLYGAGVRRPFGSLQTVQSLPVNVRVSKVIPLVDWLFVAFMAIMTVLLVWYLGFWTFVVASIFACIAAEWLAYRISIIPSFYVAGGMAAFSLCWATQKLMY